MLKKIFLALTANGSQPAMNGAMNKDLDSLQPGQMLEITRKCDGEQFTILRTDDFQHLISLLGLRTKDVEKHHES